MTNDRIDDTVYHRHKVVPLRGKSFPIEGAAADVDEAVLGLLTNVLQEQKHTEKGPAMSKIDLYADDLLSVESESYFRNRFGFALGRRGRIALMQFMDEFDLSSDDIKALQRIGSISWNGHQLRIRGEGWLKFLGTAQILVLLALLLPFLATFLLHAEATQIQQILLLAVSATLIGGALCVHRLYIAPFGCLRQRGEVTKVQV